MTQRTWQILSGIALGVGFAFLIGAFASETVFLYAIAAAGFALAAIFARLRRR
ncbi:MAG: hypothetical protein ACTS2F_10440 [Thainema sp.]